MTQSSLYLYCLARAAAVRNLTIEGLDGGLVDAAWMVRDLAALVSEVPLRAFEEAATAGFRKTRPGLFPARAVTSKSSRRLWNGPRCCQFASAPCSRTVDRWRIWWLPTTTKSPVSWTGSPIKRSGQSRRPLMSRHRASGLFHRTRPWPMNAVVCRVARQTLLPREALKAAARRRAILLGREAAKQIHHAFLDCAVEVVCLPVRSEPGTETEPVLNLALLTASSHVEELMVVAHAARFSL